MAGWCAADGGAARWWSTAGTALRRQVVWMSVMGCNMHDRKCSGAGRGRDISGGALARHAAPGSASSVEM